MKARWLMLALVLGTVTALASPEHEATPSRIPSALLAQVSSTPGKLSGAVLQISDSFRLRMLAAIGRGDLAGAISLWQLETGRRAPQWLLAFQSAFSPENQRAGPCIQAAKSIHEGFKRLGATPSYVRFTATGTQWGDDFLAFETRAGNPHSTIQISNNAVHYVVQVENRIYDAMTGPTGLVVADYMKRLFSPGVISMQTVSQLP